MMLSEENEEVQAMFWHYVVFGGILLVLLLCGAMGSVSFGDPMVGVALLLTWILYSLWSWKNKKEFFKRCVLALPFALLTLVLLKLTVFRRSDSWPFAFGMLMFVLLTRETKNVKGGFVISLIIGAILISLLAILVILINSILAGPV